jgi:hypothetical protein
VHLRESGWWQQRLARDTRLARQFYWESLAANPIAPVTYALLFLAYVPMPLLDIMARCIPRDHEYGVARFVRFGRTFARETRRFTPATAEFQSGRAKDSISS